MDVAVFPVSSTNIFPLANSHSGGQLLTEFNLKSRESVYSEGTVKYIIGPSFVHGEDDFKVSAQTDGSGVVVNSSTLQIAAGRGVIDGHYVETLIPIVIDIAELNAEAILRGDTPLTGNLCVGLRIMYSTLQTMAGAMVIENNEGYYEGLRLVVLPKDEFKLPKDVPTEQDKVTAHIKLADVIYRNGTISAKTITNNYPGKCQMIGAERVGNADNLLSDSYLRKTGLNPGDLYVFAGKGTDSSLDTWCKASDSIFVWDKNPQRTTTVPTVSEAVFTSDLDGKVKLVLPHKQVDGYKNTAGQLQYFENKVLPLPLADFSSGTSGTVDAAYTNHIKEIQEELNNIYRMPNGRQVGFLESLAAPRADNLPALSNSWEVGDYILVRLDATVDTSIDGVSAPSTLYMVLPGATTKVKFYKTDTTRTPDDMPGMELSYDEWEGNVAPETENQEQYNSYWSWSTTYRGIIGQDYFTIKHTDEEGNATYYFYVIEETGSRVYSDPIFVTGAIPLAQDNVVGGFLNVPSDLIDQGYVIRNDDGHLQLVDYALLRSGMLAYQLGENVTIPSGLTTDEVQVMLDEYVNERIAFPNASQVTSSDTPNLLEVTLTLTNDGGTLNIYNIDSRFGAAVYLTINGEADENTTINIINCEKIRINPNISGSPKINVARCGLYYDSTILDYVGTITDMRLWYEKFFSTDPDLTVDGMTVHAVDAPVVSEELDFWSTDTPNDNHYLYALQSVTFGSNGDIISFGLYVKNESSLNVALENEITVATFTLPQGSVLTYPITRMNSQIKVSGSFVTAYYSTADNGYIVIKTNFTALSEAYDGYSLTGTNATGTISFLSEPQFIRTVTGITLGTTIDSWESSNFHIFHGGVVG